MSGPLRPLRFLPFSALATAVLFAAGTRVGDPAPAFTLKSLEGKTISSAELRGSIAVIHFATSW